MKHSTTFESIEVEGSFEGRNTSGRRRIGSHEVNTLVVNRFSGGSKEQLMKMANAGCVLEFGTKEGDAHQTTKTSWRKTKTALEVPEDVDKIRW